MINYDTGRKEVVAVYYWQLNQKVMKEVYYLGVDIGTTNSKVGILDADWKITRVLRIPTPQKADADGIQVYDAERLWLNLKKLIAEMIRDYPVCSIGVTSMAEPGVLVDREKEIICGNMHSWSDFRSAVFAQTVSDAEARFYQTGMHNSQKYSVYKAMAQLKDSAAAPENMVFLQAASYIVWRLTGDYLIDETLALRTYSYHIAEKTYDEVFLSRFGLSSDIFPSVYPSGKAKSGLRPELQREFGCKAIPVAVCGHDHICAATAIGAVDDGSLFLSLGTTGVLMGSFSERLLNKSDYESGYSFGLHSIPGKMTWLGAIQSAGSAVDWGKSIIGTKEAGSYEYFNELLASKSGTIGEILFFPYLSGSGAPKLDRRVKGGFCGLDIHHDKADIIYAIVEGLGYEILMIQQNSPADEIKAVRAVGGCTKNTVLMQVLADMMGCEVAVAGYEEASLAGAAMLASDVPVEKIRENKSSSKIQKLYLPNQARHDCYYEKYVNSYLPMQEWIRGYKKQ